MFSMFQELLQLHRRSSFVARLCFWAVLVAVLTVGLWAFNKKVFLVSFSNTFAGNKIISSELDTYDKNFFQNILDSLNVFGYLKQNPSSNVAPSSADPSVGGGKVEVIHFDPADYRTNPDARPSYECYTEISGRRVKM